MTRPTITSLGDKYRNEILRSLSKHCLITVLNLFPMSVKVQVPSFQGSKITNKKFGLILVLLCFLLFLDFNCFFANFLLSVYILFWFPLFSTSERRNLKLDTRLFYVIFMVKPNYCILEINIRSLSRGIISSPLLLDCLR